MIVGSRYLWAGDEGGDIIPQSGTFWTPSELTKWEIAEVTKGPGLPRTVLVLALKFPCFRKSLSSRPTGVIAHPRNFLLPLNLDHGAQGGGQWH